MDSIGRFGKRGKNELGCCVKQLQRQTMIKFLKHFAIKDNLVLWAFVITPKQKGP